MCADYMNPGDEEGGGWGRGWGWWTAVIDVSESSAGGERESEDDDWDWWSWIPGNSGSPLSSSSRDKNLDENDIYVDGMIGTNPPPTGRSGYAAITGIYASFSSLSGTIPEEIYLLSRLRELNVHGNNIFFDGGFGGTITTELGSLKYLEYLNLQGNRLTGTVPTELGSLPRIFNLLLSGNSLKGAMTNEVCNLTTGMRCRSTRSPQ